MRAPYFLGIDVGTQGVRTVLLDATGEVVDSNGIAFLLNEESRKEQDPLKWWESTFRCLKILFDNAGKNFSPGDVRAISVTSTSGTVIPLDMNNEPLHNAIMYSDKRSAKAATYCKAAALRFHKDGYTGFNVSSGLSKMVWFVQTYPRQAEHLKKWVHAADYIIGKLSDCWGVTDYTNALKSGYDVKENVWPDYIYNELPLQEEWLPRVVAPGAVVGKITSSLANELGLSKDVLVIAGMTDGCASQIASGAVNVGDWNTTIGTTLVIKGVTENEIKDPEERLYCHRHPEGFWMPGGASNTGADWITDEFSEHLNELNLQAEKLIPSGLIAYPLRQQGERFPFIAPLAQGFEPGGLTEAERFTANMEGVAYLERYGFEMVEDLSHEKVKAVYTAGGGSKSAAWLTIRSNVLNLPIYKMKHVTGAVGAAILAASKTHFTSIMDAAHALTQIEKEVFPERELAEHYAETYPLFLQKLQQKGYIRDGQFA
jgi:sugar (pentulose or hexulose) kinase